MRTLDIIKVIFRFLLGAFFIATAVLKLVSLDHFELYIYSFNIMNFVFATVVARIVVAFEFLLGAFLILKCFYKYVWWLMLLTLVGFTFFLIYVAVFRSDSNCHCMGSLVELNPIESILKNIISIVLLIFVGKQSEIHFRFKKVAMGVVIATSVIVPFIVFPMDTLYNAFSSKAEQLNPQAFETLKQDSIFTAAVDIENNKHIIGVFASGCQYCKISTAKLNQIIEKNNLNHDKIVFTIWGDSASIEKFKAETNTDQYKYVIINPYLAIDITFGHFPTFIYTENGKATQAVDFRGMYEKDIIKMLE